MHFDWNSENLGKEDLVWVLIRHNSNLQIVGVKKRVLIQLEKFLLEFWSNRCFLLSIRAIREKGTWDYNTGLEEKGAFRNIQNDLNNNYDNLVLLTIIKILYINSLEYIHLCNWNFQTSTNLHFYLISVLIYCFYTIYFSHYSIWRTI